jgi:tetratricopeptide (TPR) repeat protein
MMQPTYILAPQAARHRTRRATIGSAIGLTIVAAMLALPGLPLSPRTLASQSVSELLSVGDRESVARRPAAALGNYERAVQAEPKSYVALWKAAREAVDLGEFETNIATRTALYVRATDYARRAIVANANDAEGHFQLSRAVGRTALAANPRDRVKYAVEVRETALKALQFQPRHPGALHVLGVWNAEVMRLNSILRSVAKAFLGGQVLGSASWPEAIRYLELAIAVEPNRLVHHLDLARIYRDAGRPNEARASYQAALRAPLQDANDDHYRQSADDELKKLR